MKPLIWMLQKMLEDLIYEIYNLNETQTNIFQDLKCSIAFHFLVFVLANCAVLDRMGQGVSSQWFNHHLLVRCY